MFLTTLATQLHKGVSWELFATSHGKGAVDGIGGTIKRKVFASVKSREFVINNPVMYYEVAKVKSPVINVLYVSTERIDTGRANLDDIWTHTNLVPGTHTLHHVGVIRHGVVETAKITGDMPSSPVELLMADEEPIDGPTNEIPPAATVINMNDVGDMVAAAYEDTYYLGEVLSVDTSERSYTLKFMVWNRKTWRWTEKPEVVRMHKNFVIQPQPTLVPTNARLDYTWVNSAALQTFYDSYKITHFS